MNDLRLPWLGPMDDKHHPRLVRRTLVSKRGLKGALVVVDEGSLGQGPMEIREPYKVPVATRGPHAGLNPLCGRRSRGAIPAVVQLARQSVCVSRVFCTFAS